MSWADDFAAWSSLAGAILGVWAVLWVARVAIIFLTSKE